MDYKSSLFFISAGEMPKKSNLIYSQVVSMAESLKDRKLYTNVSYVAFVPIRTAIVSVLRGKPESLKWLNELKIRSNVFYSLLVSNSIVTILFKKMLVKLAAQTVIKSRQFEPYENIILHCRSYLAADIAVQIKKQLRNKSISILFDMRSTLSLELGFTMGKLGVILYAWAKNWERNLIENSDLSLMTTSRGCELLRLEHNCGKIGHINILGLKAPEKDIQEMFEDKWLKKLFAYVGTISLWYSLDDIQSVLFSLIDIVEGSCAEIITSNPGSKARIPSRSIEHKNITSYYDSCLAIVVPGKKPSSYHESLNYSTNFFSTKAVEALSRGVPLIVSSEITELVEYTIKNKCGIIYSISDQGVKFKLPIDGSINDKEFWYTLSKNALLTGAEFTPSAVISKYLEFYKSMENRN